MPGHSPGLTPEPEGNLLSTSGTAVETSDFATPLNPDGSPVASRRGAPFSLFGSAAEMFLGDQEEWSAADFAPPASGSPLYFTTSLPEVRVGGVGAKVLFSGLAPGQRASGRSTFRFPKIRRPESPCR